MQFSFNSEVAKEYGVDEAIMLENIRFWILKNKANKKHEYDGEYWTYNSTRAFEEIFLFWTKRQIERILKSLQVKGLIKTGNYNKVAYDRTRWYALTDLGKSIYAFGEIEIRKDVNRNTQNVQPIPYINTYINTDNKHIYKDIIDYLNEKTDSNYKSTTKKNKSLIDARVNEGFTIEDFKKVIDIKTKEWINDANMSKFLRPETLFSNKFESYLNQKEVQNGISKQHDGKDTKFNGFKAKEFKGSGEEFNDSEIL